MYSSYYTIPTTPISINSNEQMLNASGITSNWKYRQYMQKNAQQIMKYNTKESIYDSGNNPYTTLGTNNAGSNPFLYTSIHDNNAPLYGYTTSDLKQDYLKQQQMKSRMVAPSLPTNAFK